MPTQFVTSFDNGDIFEVDYLKQFTQPLNKLESNSARFRQDTGAADDYQVDFSDPQDNGVQALVSGLTIHFKAANTNTGPATLTVEGLSGSLIAVPITKAGAFSLEAGDIQAGEIVSVIYSSAEGGRFELLGSFKRGLAGSGVTNRLAVWSSSISLMASGMEDDGSVVTVGPGGVRDFSCPGGADSERFGSGAVASGVSSVALGKQAGGASSGDDNVFIGYKSALGLTTGSNNVVIGSEAALSSSDTSNATVVGREAVGASGATVLGRYAEGGPDSLAMGYQTSALGTGAIALGTQASSPSDNAIALISVADQADSLCIGTGSDKDDVYFGQGRVSASMAGSEAFTVHSSDALGTDVGGANLRLAAGRLTGAAVGKKLVMATARAGSSGTTLRTLTDRLELDRAGVLLLKNAASAPAMNPSDGHYLYAEGGALKGRGSSGTTTTIAPADPHCPRCQRDFAVEWQSEQYGRLSICVWCLTDALERFGSDVCMVKEPANHNI